MKKQDEGERIICYYLHWRRGRRMSTCIFCIYFKYSSGKKIQRLNLKEWTGSQGTWVGGQIFIVCTSLCFGAWTIGMYYIFKIFTLNWKKTVLIIYSVPNLVLELAGLLKYSLISILSISLSLLSVSFIWILIIFCLISFLLIARKWFRGLKMFLI